jgi:hypothetical protein
VVHFSYGPSVHFRSFQPGLTATLVRLCSVVNSPIRPAGLSPAIQPASLAQRWTGFDWGVQGAKTNLRKFSMGRILTPEGTELTAKAEIGKTESQDPRWGLIEEETAVAGSR